MTERSIERSKDKFQQGNLQTQRNAGGGGAFRKQERMTSGKSCAKTLRKKCWRSMEWKKTKEEFAKAELRSRSGVSRKSITNMRRKEARAKGNQLENRVGADSQAF